MQLIYEYQSMICALTGMEVSNASLYDGASALARGVSHGGARESRLDFAAHLAAAHREPDVSQGGGAITRKQDLEFESVDFDRAAGRVSLDALRAHGGEDYAALVVQQPNFFGNLEEVDALTDWAHANKMLADRGGQSHLARPAQAAGRVGSGKDGRRGADIVCGEGQPLGVPLASGGPYFGFMATRMQYVRQMPGRIVGRTLDAEGRPGFTLTCRRASSTSAAARRPPTSAPIRGSR